MVGNEVLFLKNFLPEAQVEVVLELVVQKDLSAESTGAQQDVTNARGEGIAPRKFLFEHLLDRFMPLSGLRVFGNGQIEIRCNHLEPVFQSLFSEILSSFVI